MKKIVLTCVITILFIGCGGGSDKSTNNTKTYNLRDMYSYGYKISYSGTLEMNVGDVKINAEKTLKLASMEQINNITVRPVEKYISQTIFDPSVNQKIETSEIGIIHYDAGNNIIKTFDYDTYKTCDAIKIPSPMSSHAKIGDYGVSSHLLCDNTYTKTTWILNAYNNSLATLVYTTKTYDNVTNNLKSTLTVKQRIDTNGVIVHEERQGYMVVNNIKGIFNITSQKINVIKYKDGPLP